MQLSKARAEQHALALDRALATALAAAQQYSATGREIERLTVRTVSNLHEDDLTRAHDMLTMYLPRATGAGTALEVELLDVFRQLAAALGLSEAAARFLDRTPGVSAGSVSAASTADAKQLAEWFAEVPGDREPRPHRVLERSFINDAIREVGEEVTYAGHPSPNLELITDSEGTT